MAVHDNGRIPPEALTPLSVGGSLLSGAAASFERWSVQATAAGRELTITSVADAYRSFQQQHDVFVSRYEVVAGNGPFNDVRIYEGKRYVRLRGAAAAVPGTSNHGRGIAIDIKNAGDFGGSFHTWLSATGPALGWTNDEGRSVNEPWHWVYGGSNPTPPTTPTTPSEEDDMPFRIHVTSSPNTPSEVGKVYLAQFGPTGHCLFQHINPEENGVHDLVKTPIYNVSHYQKDVIRKNIITREAAWKVA